MFKLQAPSQTLVEMSPGSNNAGHRTSTIVLQTAKPIIRSWVRQELKCPDKPTTLYWASPRLPFFS